MGRIIKYEHVRHLKKIKIRGMIIGQGFVDGHVSWKVNTGGKIFHVIPVSETMHHRFARFKERRKVVLEGAYKVIGDRDILYCNSLKPYSNKLTKENTEKMKDAAQYHREDMERQVHISGRAYHRRSARVAQESPFRLEASVAVGMKIVGDIKTRKDEKKRIDKDAAYKVKLDEKLEQPVF